MHRVDEGSANPSFLFHAVPLETPWEPDPLTAYQEILAFEINQEWFTSWETRTVKERKKQGGAVPDTRHMDGRGIQAMKNRKLIQAHTGYYALV